MLNRFGKSFSNLMVSGVALALTTPALAGSPPTPTATTTPIPTATATATASPTATLCGNGIVDPGEDCDPPLSPEGGHQCGDSPENVCLGGQYGPACTCAWFEVRLCELDKKCSIRGSEPADQCEATPGDEVTYTYIVGPVSAYEATVEITDDKLGVVATDLAVPILGKVEVTATTTIFETTTNTAWISDAGSVACQIPTAGTSVTVTVATPTATPTETPVATPSPKPTAEPSCTDRWEPVQICTIGKGQSPSNNPKVSMCITGNIVDPDKLGATAHRIPVCAGTDVNVVVADLTGTPTVSAGGGLSCDSAGCTGVVHVAEKFKVVSSDGKDTDRMTLLPKP